MSDEANFFDNPERIEQINSIIPRMAAVAEVGDEVTRGLGGDPMNPWQDDATPPTATVVDVQHDADGTSLTLRDSATGELIAVPKNTVNPLHMFEYTDQSFQNILQRNADDMGDADHMESMSAVDDGMDGMEMMGAEGDISGPGGPLDGPDDSADGDVDDHPDHASFNRNMIKVVRKTMQDLRNMERTYRRAFAQMGVHVGDPLQFTNVFVNEYKATVYDSDDSGSEKSDDSDRTYESDSEASSADSMFARDLLAED